MLEGLELLETTIDSDNLSSLLGELEVANEAFLKRFPGAVRRHPVHTVYGGANLYQPGAADKLGQLARRHMAEYAPDVANFAELVGLDAQDPIVEQVYARVIAKLEREPIEDHRVDFEDGYGSRTDEEEDQHIQSAAAAMADGLRKGQLPKSVGIRIKAFSEEAKRRSLRTLDLFVSSLTVQAEGRFPPNFYVTLPKVTSVAQVKVLNQATELLEQRIGIAPGTIKLEIMLENVQVLFNESGAFGLRELVSAGNGRVATMVLGTFDYTASANVASVFQTHDHPSADFARQMLISALTDSEVNVCDGVTNIMPIPLHRGAEIGEPERQENRKVVSQAWQLHFENILHSMRLGIYQGWDLNPAQLPIRFSAVFYFYLRGLAEAQSRLSAFIDRAAQASLSGNTFDDAATGQGLVNFFSNGIQCGALLETDLAPTGLTVAELERRSFAEIVEARSSTHHQ